MFIEKIRHGNRFFFIFVAVILAFLILFTGNNLLSAQPKATTAWTRTHEPVIVTGDQVPGLISATISNVLAYAYSGSVWNQVPVQVDEVDYRGVFTPENSILDGNDEIIFMAKDGGEKAGQLDWIADEGSKDYPRYEIKVVNPLTPTEIGYIYLYSSTLPATFGDYINWNESAEQIESDIFELGVNTTDFAGVDYLTLNGNSSDILDRSKIEVEVLCYRNPNDPIVQTMTEEDLGDQGLSLAPNIDGAVRVGGGFGGQGLWAYESFYQISAGFLITTVTVDECPYGVVFNYVRFSYDLVKPSTSGFAPAYYYDVNNLSGIEVDGTPDAISTDPVDWVQISGSYGSILQMRDISLEGGSVLNFYKDDADPDPDNRGDYRSYGETGVEVQSPTGTLMLNMQQIILNPSLPPVGNTYLEYKQNPLAVTVLEQPYSDSIDVFIPLVLVSTP